MTKGGFDIFNKELEKYINNYLEKDCKLNWINYSIVVANNYLSQTVFVRYKNMISALKRGNW